MTHTKEPCPDHYDCQTCYQYLNNMPEVIALKGISNPQAFVEAAKEIRECLSEAINEADKNATIVSRRWLFALTNFESAINQTKDKK